VPLFWPPLPQLSLALQAHVLSPQARATVAPPVTVALGTVQTGAFSAGAG